MLPWSITAVKLQLCYFSASIWHPSGSLLAGRPPAGAGESGRGYAPSCLPAHHPPTSHRAAGPPARGEGQAKQGGLLREVARFATPAGTPSKPATTLVAIPPRMATPSPYLAQAPHTRWLATPPLGRESGSAFRAFYTPPDPPKGGGIKMIYIDIMTSLT